MYNCKVLGCTEVTEEKQEEFCKTHLQIVSRHHIKARKHEAEAYLQCARYQRFRKILAENVPCFKCRGAGEVVHYIDGMDGDLHERLMYLCHICHGSFHNASVMPIL